MLADLVQSLRRQAQLTSQGTPLTGGRLHVAKSLPLTHSEAIRTLTDVGYRLSTLSENGAKPGPKYRAGDNAQLSSLSIN